MLSNTKMEKLLEIFQRGDFPSKNVHCSFLIIMKPIFYTDTYIRHIRDILHLCAHCSTCYCPAHRNLNALVGGLQKSAHTGKKLKSPNYVTLHFHLMWRQSCKKLLWRRFKWVYKNEDCKEHRWKSPKYSRRYWEWESSGGLFYLANYICQNCQMYLSKV